ncbi:uncharacterized protein [Hetaerina americana]|uniref:uncharacterized protein n=1 Tax=Hetaerina americana TaxID=62018 RepID=UPI003A7F24D1
MELFTKDDLNAMISAAMMSPNFKVIEYKFDSVYNFGNTKMGRHCRLMVIVEYPDDVRRTHSFFSKFVPEIEEYKNFVRVNDCFGKEAYFYSHIASIMKTLLPSEIPLPIPMCYFARGGSRESVSLQPCPNFEASAIILQDLLPLGYQPMDMWTLLDLSHCRIVMRALAIFHGGSVLLQQSKSESLEYEGENEAIILVNESVFISDEESLSNKILHACSETTASVICQIWPIMYPKERSYNKLLHAIWNSWKNVFSMLHTVNRHKRVICHGELCGNNILFAYEREHHGGRKPVDVKFVDMQLLRYAPPITDILMFLHVCTRRMFRHEHLSNLLSYYHIEFVRAVSPKVANKTLPLEALKTSVEDMREFGLMAAIYLLPKCLAYRPARRSAEFHFSPERFGNFSSPRESHFSKRYSLNDAEQYYQNNSQVLFENQAPRILERMEENRSFKIRLIEAYEEYLEFIGLWKNPLSSQ